MCSNIFQPRESATHASASSKLWRFRTRCLALFSQICRRRCCWIRSAMRFFGYNKTSCSLCCRRRFCFPLELVVVVVGIVCSRNRQALDESDLDTAILLLAVLRREQPRLVGNVFIEFQAAARGSLVHPLTWLPITWLLITWLPITWLPIQTKCFASALNLKGKTLSIANIKISINPSASASAWLEPQPAWLEPQPSYRILGARKPGLVRLSASLGLASKKKQKKWL